MVADGDRPTVLSVQKYESGPPVADSSDRQLVSSDGDTVAATKQEEWVKKKRVELTTTKQIETRVKRQIVLEDGKVVDDSGPIVTTNTTEDTDKQESEHTEHFTHGDAMEGKEGWVAIEEVPEDAVVKETNEKKITTHDEVEDIYETEEIQHLGDHSNEGIVRALRENQDVRKGLLSSSERRDMLPYYNKDPQKKVLQQSRRHDRTTDIEDTKEVSKMKDNGNVITEITRRHEHEEFHNEDIPDSESDEFEHIENQEGSRDYSHAKSENFVEYLAVPKGGKPSQGIKIGDGARIVSENISSQRQGDDDIWDSVSDRVRRLPKPDTLYSNKFGAIPQVRPDVLTNRPMDSGHEEYTKRNETNRWLNSHFGSSSSSLNSETSPRSPLAATPTGIHVTMTSRSSPLNSPPPAPPLPAGKHNPSSRHNHSAKFASKSEKEPVVKKISFGDSPSRPSPNQHTVHFDLKNRHEDVMRSLNSQPGRVLVTKSGSPWDEEPTPTPPPRSRRTKSPDARADNFSHIDQTHHIKQTGIMNNHSSRKYAPEYTSSYLQKSGDVGERKGYERREQSFGYNGPTSTNHTLNRDSLESGNFGTSGYVSKQSNYYKANETDNPGQNSLYENGEAEVEQRKTVNRREKVFSYDGPPQKQFHPKYIVGTPSSTMGRLKGIEHTGAVIEDTTDNRSQTLPRRRFYFGDDEGSLLGGDGKKTATGKAIRFGTDDINVSISNSYQNANEPRKTASLSRSMSFTPRSVGREKPTFNSSRLSQAQKHSQVYTSNPQLLDSPDLLAPKLLQSMSKSVRDVNSVSRERNDQYSFSNRQQESTNVSKSKRTFLENLKKNSLDLYEPALRGSKASSPARSMTPTNAYSPLRNSAVDNTRSLTSRNSLSSPRGFGGANSPMSDDYQETYRMSSSTPDHEEGKPRISTDTTSRFARRTLRGTDGQPAGKVESSTTETRTKSRYKESEVMFPNGRRVGSPASFQGDYQPRQLTSGTVVIPVTANNRNGHFRK